MLPEIKFVKLNVVSGIEIYSDYVKWDTVENAEGYLVKFFDEFKNQIVETEYVTKRLNMKITKE